jgi:hypothetical protein
MGRHLRHRHRLRFRWRPLHDHLPGDQLERVRGVRPFSVDQRPHRRYQRLPRRRPSLRPVPAAPTHPLRGIGGDWSQAAYGVGMDITIKVSTEANYFDGTNWHSAFQENLTLLLVEAYFGFVMGSPDAFVAYTKGTGDLLTNVISVSVRGSSLFPDSFAWDRFGNLDLVSSSASWTDFDNQFGTSASITTGGSMLLSGGSPTLAGAAGSLFPEEQAGPSWSGAATKIVVTYDHGYATVPGDIVNEVAGMVAQQIAVPTGITSEQIGGYRVAYGRSVGGGAALSLAPSSMTTFDRYRVKVTSSDTSRPR